MLTIVWILWALQIAGIATMEYSKLWIITIALVAFTIVCKGLYNKLANKLIEIQLEACGDAKGQDAIPVLLALILNKIATK